MSLCTVTIEPGHRGTISGTVCARFHQRATVSLRNAAGRIIALTTLVGRGDNVPCVLEANPPCSLWAFGPFSETVYADLLIESSEKGDNFTPSKIIKPIAVSKLAEGATQPVNYLVTTILSEDHVDNDYTDCILTIHQYK